LRYDSIRALITPTKFLQRAYRENGFNQPMHNIAFGVNIGRGAKPARQPGRPLQIGFIGQIARHKGTDLLVEAFARLPRGSAELQVYGGVDQEPVFLQALRDAVHDHGVHFRGTFPREQMRTVLDGLDLLVIPSRWPENSPLVLLDALASHTPVIVADVAGLTEFLEPGKNGIAFERGSVDDLERALRCFVSGDLDAAAMTATTHFERTTATMTEDVLSIYRSVM
jgi:glycosyltransferase involved in cell wall biosynthesis